VGTRARRSTEERRVNMCLELAHRHSARPGPGRGLSGRASIALASAEAAGTWAARSLLRDTGRGGSHEEALAFLDRLIEAGEPAGWLGGRTRAAGAVALPASRARLRAPRAGRPPDGAPERAPALTA
jgi:hypothetical protein